MTEPPQNISAVCLAEGDTKSIVDRFVNFQRVVVLFQRQRQLLLIEEERAEFEIRVGDLRLAVALLREVEFLVERLKAAG